MLKHLLKNRVSGVVLLVCAAGFSAGGEAPEAAPDAGAPAPGGMIGDIPIEDYWGSMWLMDSENKPAIHLAPSNRKTTWRGLVGYLDHDDPGIRASAVGWLGSLREHARPALPRLREMLKDPDAGVRERAARSIARITGSDKKE